MNALQFVKYRDGQISQVGVEAVASIDETSDFVVGEAVFVKFGSGVFEDVCAILGHAEAEVVCQVSLELIFIDPFLFEVGGVFIKHSLDQSQGVRLAVEHANLVQICRVLVLWIPPQDLSVRSSSNSVRFKGEWLFPGCSLACTCKLFAKSIVFSHFFFKKSN